MNLSLSRDVPKLLYKNVEYRKELVWDFTRKRRPNSSPVKVETENPSMYQYTVHK